jgi:hypothetical protein
VVKRCDIRWRGVLALTGVLALGALAGTPASAADSADKPKQPARVEKAKKPAPAPVVTATKPVTPKKAKPVPPPRPPEKSYEAQRAEDGPWAKCTNWLSFRAGYAKASGPNAGDGLGGYGVAYQRMLSKKWAFGASMQHDVVGHLAHAYEISVPFTAEFTRHIAWKTQIHPYLGVGGGYYFHKYYRTGADYTGAPGGGWYLNGGFNLPIDDRHNLGLDTRLSFVATRKGVVNPVFGAETSGETLWSVKLNWAFVY